MAVVDPCQNFFFAVEQEHLSFAPQPNLDIAPSLPTRRVIPSHAFVSHYILLLIEDEGNVIERIAIINGNPALPECDAAAIVSFHRQYLSRFYAGRGIDQGGQQEHSRNRD